MQDGPSIEEPVVESNKDKSVELADVSSDVPTDSVGSYRLYRGRFAGLTGLVFLNIAAGMAWPWFGPISNNMVSEFGFTLNQVNWLGNIVSCVYLPTALLVPVIVSRYGIRRCCDIGAAMLLLSAWVRYAGTVRSLSKKDSYALLFVGQSINSVSQPIFQVLAPKYSETWFDLKGRTTATMIVAISNPIGGALGQLLSPLVGDSRQSILVLGIISSAAIPFVFLIGKAPPTPPTYAGSKPSPSLLSLVRAMLGMQTPHDARIGLRERIDFGILIITFGVFAAAVNSFAILTAQILQPVGYSDSISGLMGACLILSGILTAVVTAPLFDRVFTHRLALALKIIVPIIACAWLSLIWAVRPHDTAGLFVIMAIIGVCSVTLLPVTLELACDLTRNADGSSAILWFSANLFCITFLLSQGALRAAPDAKPPLNMHNALIFNGAFVMSAGSLIFLIRGHQARKELDEEKLQQSLEFRAQHVNEGLVA